MGFVVLLLTAPLHGYDLLADPLGWLLVLGGVAHLPLDPATRSRLRALALLALVVSVVTWPGPVVHWLQRTDDSLPWAVGCRRSPSRSCSATTWPPWPAAPTTHPRPVGSR